jgi:hypothetical protein
MDRSPFCWSFPPNERVLAEPDVFTDDRKPNEIRSGSYACTATDAATTPPNASLVFCPCSASGKVARLRAVILIDSCPNHAWIVRKSTLRRAS